MYMYVDKNEYAPVRKELEDLILRVQTGMRSSHGISFRFRLMGSGRKHLIVKNCWVDGGYEFDFDLVMLHPGEKEYKAHLIMKYFMDAFKEALKGSEYSNPMNPTTSITLKLVNKNTKTVRCICNFTILYYGTCEEMNGFYYLRYNTKLKIYEFAFREMASDIGEKVDAIMEQDGWKLFRREYLKIKNINEGKVKPSYSIYAEAVNNTYNQMFKPLAGGFLSTGEAKEKQ